MLISKFNPAFLGGTGENISLQGYCPGFILQPETGQTYFYNKDTLEFSPFYIHLDAVATGQSPIFYTWQTGASIDGQYVDISSGYNSVYSSAANLDNTNIWYRVKATNQLQCTGYSSGIYVNRFEYSNNSGYVLEIFETFPEGNYSADDIKCCGSDGIVEFFLRPYQENSGLPDPFDTSPCEWTSVLSNRILVTGYNDQDFSTWKQVSLGSFYKQIDISESNKYGVQTGVYDKTWWCSYGAFWLKKNSGVLADAYENNFGAAFKNTLILNVDGDPGPHLPTSPSGSWGTGQYFIHAVAHHYRNNFKSCDFGNGYESSCADKNLLNNQPLLIVSTDFYETGSDPFTLGSKLPNSGSPPLYKTEYDGYPPIVTVHSGETNLGLVRFSVDLSCGFCPKPQEIEMIYAYAGSNLPEITGKYTLLTGFADIQTLISSGLYNQDQFDGKLTGDGGLYDPRYSANFCNCQVTVENACEGLGTIRDPDFCKKPIYKTIGLPASSTPNVNCYEIPYRKSDRFQYYDSRSSGASLITSNLAHVGEIVYLGVGGYATSQIRVGASYYGFGAVSQDINPSITLDANSSFVRYWDPCDFKVKYLCNGVEYDELSGSSCVHYYTPFEGRFSPIFNGEVHPSGRETVAECDGPTAEESCIPDSGIDLYKCQQFGSTQRKRMVELDTRKVTVNLLDGNCVTVNARFFSTDYYDLTPIP